MLALTQQVIRLLSRSSVHKENRIRKLFASQNLNTKTSYCGTATTNNRGILAHQARRGRSAVDDCVIERGTIVLGQGTGALWSPVPVRGGSRSAQDARRTIDFLSSRPGEIEERVLKVVAPVEVQYAKQYGRRR